MTARALADMHLTIVESQAITARMALIVGRITFDRLFVGVRFDELDADLLYVYARDEEAGAEIEDQFALHILIIAADILKRESDDRAGFAKTS